MNAQINFQPPYEQTTLFVEGSVWGHTLLCLGFSLGLILRYHVWRNPRDCNWCQELNPCWHMFKCPIHCILCQYISIHFIGEICWWPQKLKFYRYIYILCKHTNRARWILCAHLQFGFDSIFSITYFRMGDCSHRESYVYWPEELYRSLARLGVIAILIMSTFLLLEF